MAVAGLVAGLVLAGLVSRVQAGPHFVLEKVTVTKGGQTYTLAKNTNGEWMIPVWPDVPAVNPLADDFTWRIEPKGGALSPLDRSDVKLGGVSKGGPQVVIENNVKKARKNIIFNYNQMNFPTKIQLVVIFNPAMSAADVLVKVGQYLPQ